MAGSAPAGEAVGASLADRTQGDPGHGAFGVPHWILETQRLSWTGSWEETALKGEQPEWVLSLKGQAHDPAPFESFTERDSQCRWFSRVSGHSPAELRALVYPREGASPEYLPDVDDSTDPDGWNYGSKASRLGVKRSGGRAVYRIGDGYRRRWWCHRDGMPSPKGVRSVPLAQDANDTTRVFGSLNDAIISVLGRRSIAQIPLDPTAALRRSQKDKQRFQELRERLPKWTDVDILGAHCVAALYSRAAYGLVGRLGKFDNMAAGAMVFSLEKAKFNMADDTDDASNNMAFVDALGLSSDDIVCAYWKSFGPFCPAHVVARDHAMKWIVVAIRGTLSHKDILTDMAAHNVPFLEGTVHEGFHTAMQRLLSVLGDILQEELAKHPDYRLVLCGHSMGGAIAAMGAAKLRREAPWAANCIAFGIGTPGVVARCVGERLARERAVFTAVNGRDWSPRTSSSNVMELLDDLCELSLVRSAMRAATGSQSAPSRVEDARNEQLPPGALLQIVSTGTEPELLKAEPKDYRHAMSVWPDVEAHIPIFYIQELLPGFATALRNSSEHSAAVPASSAGAEPAAEAAAGNLGREASLAALRRMCLGQALQRQHSGGLPAWPDRARELVTEVFAPMFGIGL